jgi:hypothetical protein
MHIKLCLIKNTVFITPALSVGCDEIMERNVFWINLSFLSFDLMLIFGV